MMAMQHREAHQRALDATRRCAAAPASAPWPSDSAAARGKPTRLPQLAATEAVHGCSATKLGSQEVLDGVAAPERGRHADEAGQHGADGQRDERHGHGLRRLVRPVPRKVPAMAAVPGVIGCRLAVPRVMAAVPVPPSAHAGPR